MTTTYLDSLINHENNLRRANSSIFTLENIKKLLAQVGNPQDQLNIIHVAGSKGKGSTCALTAQILHEAGYRVGLYTSPHLQDVTERIRVIGTTRGTGIFKDAISEAEFQAGLQEIKPAVDHVKNLTYFEILTAWAFIYFMRQKVDFAVIETGLGGRLDATNVGLSKVCAITPIELEHTRILGSTLKDIAREKAAIIKDPRQQVVVAPQAPEARKVIDRRCRMFGICPVWVRRKSSLKTVLLGRYQKINAATAVEIVKCLRARNHVIRDEAIFDGLHKAFWPGRFEVVSHNPVIILDSAHTPESARILAESLRAEFPGKKVVLVLGVAHDKDKRALGQRLAGLAEKVIITRFHHVRSGSFQDDEIRAIFKKTPYVRAESVREAMDLAYQAWTSENIILITGSLFLIGEARKLCINTRA